MKSDFVKKGTERAPHRSLFNAAGYTDEELERPLIGVVNSFNEIVPGHMNLDKICEAVKKGIYLAGAPAYRFARSRSSAFSCNNSILADISLIFPL